MDLLSKFDLVIIESDARISETDKEFCTALQSAYDTAKASLMELKYFWEDIVETQKRLLCKTGVSDLLFLTQSGELRLSSQNIENQLRELHGIFIESIVRHFNQIYHVKLSSDTIMESLLPQKPDRYSTDAALCEEYDAALLQLSLSNATVIEQIFAQMDGRNLWEQALYELKSACQKAAWSSHNKSAKYERKKHLLQFSSYSCHYEKWFRSEKWELTSDLKQIFRGIAHYETGSFSLIPNSMAAIFSYQGAETDCVVFSDCRKVSQLKMFKNGRVDIRFSDEDSATQFAEDYLGTIYSEVI